jgi:hypothetical protein
VRFHDYDTIRTGLANGNIDATPRIDLGSLKPEDITDDEEG